MENFDVGGGNFTFMEIGIGFMTPTPQPPHHDLHS
ncbi:hypothetical protein, partial [Staphylococcus aureus]